MVGLILRLSIAAESFTSYVQLSEEAPAGAADREMLSTTTGQFPHCPQPIIHY
jgi:hypothetical protein